MCWLSLQKPGSLSPRTTQKDGPPDQTTLPPDQTLWSRHGHPQLRLL